MSKHETIVQYTKIALAIIVAILILLGFQRICHLLELIIQKI